MATYSLLEATRGDCNNSLSELYRFCNNSWPWHCLHQKPGLGGQIINLSFDHAGKQGIAQYTICWLLWLFRGLKGTEQCQWIMPRLQLSVIFTGYFVQPFLFGQIKLHLRPSVPGMRPDIRTGSQKKECSCHSYCKTIVDGECVQFALWQSVMTCRSTMASADSHTTHSHFDSPVPSIPSFLHLSCVMKHRCIFHTTLSAAAAAAAAFYFST